MKEGLRKMEERAETVMAGGSVPSVEHTPDTVVKVQMGGRGFNRVLMTPRVFYQLGSDYVEG